MNWETTDEEKLLKQAAADFFQEKMPIKDLRYLRDAKDASGYIHEKWAEMTQLGWAGILIPEEHGGLAFGFRGLGLILEEAGRTLAATPLIETVAGASSLIDRIGNDAQRAQLLPAIAEGKLLLALAYEEGTRHGIGEIATTATTSATGFTLNGKKSMVLDGWVADKLIVLARTSPASGKDGGLSWLLVDRKTDGVSIEPFKLLDGRTACSISFKQVNLSRDALLGDKDQAGGSLADVLDATRIALAAEMLGSAEEAFNLTVKYVKERKQFGVAIGTFQALQHRLAHLYGELAVARAVVARGLSALDERHSDVPRLASLAKAKVSEVFQHVAREAIQMHGGIGMTDEHNIGFYLKRARVSAELAGSPSFHRDRYASLLEF